jgi:hypothetical protein
VALIDARLVQIEKAKQELLQAVADSGQSAPVRLPGLELRPAPRRSTRGFKVRY